MGTICNNNNNRLVVLLGKPHLGNIMNPDKFDLLYVNKQWQHPVLGHVDCKAMRDTFKECINDVGVNNSQVYCVQIFELVTKCYKSRDQASFNAWVDKKLEDRKKLHQYLEKRQSTIPLQLRRHNTWGIFDPFSRASGKQKPGKKGEEVDMQKLSQNMKLLRDLEK